MHHMLLLLDRKEGVTLSEGETLVGVMEIKKGQYFFIGLNTKDNAHGA